MNDINRAKELFRLAYVDIDQEKLDKVTILKDNHYIKSGDNILDFGRGNGRFTIEFSK